MRLVVDLQACQTESSRQRGIGRYSMALTRALARRREEDLDLRVALNAAFPESIEEVRRGLGGLPSSAVTQYRTPSVEGVSSRDAIRKVGNILAQQHWASLNPDIVHVSSLFEGAAGKAPLLAELSAFPKALKSATLYDLIPLIYADVYLAHPETADWYHGRLEALRECDLLLSISEASRRDAIERLQIAPEKVVNISGAVDDQFRRVPRSPAEKMALQRRYGITRPFVMYTGGIDHRKNVEGLIAAFAALPAAVRDAHQLVVVCAVSQAQREELSGLAARLRLPGGALVLTGYVTDDDLVALYNDCIAFVFPSLYEGFGLPVLEAMSCGAPTIAGNNSSIPELLQRSDALFDACDTAAITERLHHVLTDEAFRAELARFGAERAKQFSWDRTARTAIEAWREAEARHRAERMQALRSAEKPRLAYISPLPPMKTGIADYSAELLPTLAEWFSIDVYTQPRNDGAAYQTGGLPLFPIAQYAQRKAQYACTMLHMGNSEFHDYMFGFLEAQRAIVVLHDFYLSGILNWIAHSAGNPNQLQRELAYAHGPEAARVHAESPLDAIMEFPTSRRVVERAEFLIFHSKYAEGLIERFYPDLCDLHRAVIPQIRKLPDESEMARRSEVRQRFGFRPDEVIVATFGFAAPTKATDRIVRMFLQPPLSQQADVRLVIAGELPDDGFGREIRAALAGAAPNHRVQVTGFLAASQYADLLLAADVAVQLRTITRGETSRAVLDALASGTAVVVNDFAAFHEYPDDVVAKIPAEFTNAELTQVLMTLCADPELRRRYASRGHAYVADTHAPERVAALYALAINDHQTIKAFMSDDAVIGRLADCLQGAGYDARLADIIDDLLLSWGGRVRFNEP